MIDSHCHLADDVFAADAAAVIERAKAAGLEGALCILDVGSSVERERAFELARAWPALRFSIGVHPHQAGTWAGRVDAAVAEVERALDEQPASRAIGEIGLDYHYDFSPKDVQHEVFAAQVALALERDLPIVIHAREADDDALSVIREAGKMEVRGVMHCFTGSASFARRSLDLGFYISLAGIVTFPKAGELRDVARLVPDDRLLIETDSPFLAPVPFRGKRNEPAWVVQVAERIAEVRGMTTGALAALTTRNYEMLVESPKGIDLQGLAR